MHGFDDKLKEEFKEELEEIHHLDKDSLYFTFLEVFRLHYCRTRELLEEIGIYPGQPPLLMILAKYEGISQKEIAAKLGIKPSTVTVMLRRMENSELVKREQDKDDQRVSRVYITEKGRVLFNKSKNIMTAIQEVCFSSFSAEEKEALHDLLKQMRDNLL